jgi:hypothetical protein
LTIDNWSINLIKSLILTIISVIHYKNSIMKENIIKDKSFLFAVRIINLYKYLIEIKREYVLSKQVLRSGTAIGAMIRESEQAE